MENIDNLNSQTNATSPLIQDYPITPNINLINSNPPSPKSNIFKVLFYIFFALFLISISSVTYISLENNDLKKILKSTDNLVENNKTNKTTENKEESTNENIISISNIQIELPKDWKIISKLENQIIISINLRQKEIIAELIFQKNNEETEFAYDQVTEKFTTNYANIFKISDDILNIKSGIQIINDTYLLSLNTISKNIDNNELENYINSDVLFEIMKTVKPIDVDILLINDNIKKYTDSKNKFSIKYPSSWYTNIEKPKYGETIYSISNKLNSDTLYVQLFTNYKETFSKGMEFEDFLTKYNDYYQEYEKVKINSYDVYKHEYFIKNKIINTDYYFVIGNNLYVVYSDYTFTDDESEILNSFNILE